MKNNQNKLDLFVNSSINIAFDILGQEEEILLEDFYSSINKRVYNRLFNLLKLSKEDVEELHHPFYCSLFMDECFPFKVCSDSNNLENNSFDIFLKVKPRKLILEEDKIKAIEIINQKYRDYLISRSDKIFERYKL